MVDWLRRLFRRMRPPALVPPARVAVKTVKAGPAPASPSEPAGAHVEPGAEPAAVFSLILPAERIDAAVAALRAHVASHPPRLGAFPGTAARILQVFKEVDPDYNRVVHELQQDAAVVTKLLNVANSAFFGGGPEVNDIRGAILRIGMRDVAQIAIGVAGHSLFEPSSRSAFSLMPHKWNELFHTSMSAAFAASWLSQVARVGRSDHAFLSGLLHDVGQPMALRALADLVIEGALERDVLDAAGEIIDRVHIELGRSVTTTDGLPEYLCAAASLHHDAEVPVGPEHAELHLVRIIDGIAAQRRGPMTPAQKDALDRSAAALSLDPRWTRIAVTEYETLAAQVTRMFGIADPFRPVAATAVAAG
ncbi:MAG TPA: HDOD domain-containing protein [Kofleriaceae bacterium]|nr:HDOD domain-containing protein [Kofleriaceae bacterium]